MVAKSSKPRQELDTETLSINSEGVVTVVQDPPPKEKTPATAPNSAMTAQLQEALKDKGGEKRQHQRIHARLPYTMAYEGLDHASAKCSGYTADLSQGGTSIMSTSSNIGVGVEIAIRVDLLLHGKPCHFVATGKIVNKTFSSQSGGFRYGIQFLKISTDYVQLIQNFIQAFNKRAF